eukprot:SAG22_NODE_623_length_8459_cov_39.989474_8_plen_37_part_00
MLAVSQSPIDLAVEFDFTELEDLFEEWEPPASKSEL